MMNRKRRAIVVEDNFLLCDLLADSLRALDYDVVSHVATLSDGLKALETFDIDLAVVDINLRGAEAYPLLDVMSRRYIAFVIATVEARRDIPERFANRSMVHKPYNLSEFRHAVSQSF